MKILTFTVFCQVTLYVTLAFGLTSQVTTGQDDTITIEACSNCASENIAGKTRVKRQSHLPGSIFAGFPGFDGQFGAFPGSNLGGIPQNPGFPQFPSFQLQPVTQKPVPPVASSGTCRTTNGSPGKCVPLRQCFPLLFSSAQDELGYSGLANSLSESSGTCATIKSPFLYAIGGPTGGKNGICCASEGSNTGGQRPVPGPTTVAPATTSPPAWHQPIPTTPASATELPQADPYNCAGYWRIIGGSNVAGRPYPWIVSIKDGRTNRHVCGGSLISPRSVLSAAHCVQTLDGQRVANIRVYLGANDITAAGRCTVVKKVKNIKYHRGFSMKTLHHDVAILTLDSPVSLNSNVQTVQLASAPAAAGTQATVAGWGGVQFGGGTVGQLRHVNLDIISNNVCAAKYVGHAPAGIIQHQLCAGSPGRDSCVGDSGGPLMQNGVQIGIVSYGVNCGVQPGVYTRVTSYLSWINKNKS